ncbi:hypothetical protein B0J11DRAFT_228002 [Dendryphion nanum]|uniref:Zn(2)-C6 fungal-type domain-containing protein n=1 Tax=Dendryphion nanum TaxID=256645 RepID=A0A9P9IRG2_9PLEO|nr:hypothetical protein B0J11DRAFT_228002 [Dendryphion nanum]
MRQRSGCKACRERHIKCVKLRDSEKCKYCTERKRQCIRGNAFRFRPVTTVKFNAGEDVGSAEQSLEFRGSQTWVHIPTSLRFVPPNTDGDEEALDLEPERTRVLDPDPEPEPEPEPKSAEAESDDDIHGIHEPSIDRIEFGQSPASLFAIANRTALPNDLDGLHRTNSNSSATFELPALFHSPLNSAPLLPPISDRLPDISPHNKGKLADDDHNAFSSSHSLPERTTDSIHLSPPQDVNISPFSNSAFSPNSSLHLRWPVNSAYEARLFHHFIVHCSPWIDVCDIRCHFGKEVPKRAAHFPVILNGILGLAARHLWLIEKTDKDRSQGYIDNCLQALIVALQDPLAHWDENFLVAVILLRLHEEMGDADEQCHHFGTARILNSISSFAADGGLRESASWVSLRQHIYVSLTTQQPLNLSLDNYKHSAVFREYDDESWANRIIFQFATILHHVFESHEGHSLTREKWAELDGDVEEWERTKPWTFTALHIEPDAGNSFDGTWPLLPCAHGVVAVGLQYYHLCKILLTVYSPHASLVGLAGVRSRKLTDAVIRRHIRIVIGYGASNSNCTNAAFQGSHILSACGAYVLDRMEQEACITYLQSLQRLMGWRTDKVVLDLREQWAS